MTGDNTAGADPGFGAAGVGTGPRRALLRGAAGLLALATTSCGFRPMYGSGSGATPAEADVASDLAATRVGLIAERFGQHLRRALEVRLGQVNGTPAAARYELRVVPSNNAEVLGFLRDGQATRVRYIATANWSLVRLPGSEIVANGFERTIESFNALPNQNFATDLSRDAAERRLAQVLAEEVVTRLVIRLRAIRAGGAPDLIQPVEPLSPIPEPLPPSLTPGGLNVPQPGVQGGLSGGIGPDSLR